MCSGGRKLFSFDVSVHSVSLCAFLRSSDMAVWSLFRVNSRDFVEALLPLSEFLIIDRFPLAFWKCFTLQYIRSYLLKQKV